MGEGSGKFLIGATVGAVGGFVLGSVAATPAARSASQAVAGSLEVSVRFLGRSAVKLADGIGLILESGYTRLRSTRGREAYLEHEIEELREQITRLEQRMD